MAEIQNDDHPCIIKTPDSLPTSQYGLGYDIFHDMKRYHANIAQYIVETDESQTYAELLQECIKVAINLRAENLSDDDIVGLCVDNHRDSCVPYTACLFNGIIVVPLNNGPVIAEEQAEFLRKVTPKMIFVDENILQNLEESLKIAELNVKLVVLGANSNGHMSYSDFLVASNSEVVNFQPVKLNSNKRTAVIFSGSGTSGTIKPICLSHHGLQSRTADGTLLVGLIVAKLYWITHFLGTFGSIRSGSPRVIMKESEASNVWKVIEKYKVSYFLGSVFQTTNLLKYSKPKDVDLSSLRMLVAGGVAFPAITIRKLQELIPKVIILSAYGLTEIGGHAVGFNPSKPEDLKWFLKKPKSCGRPLRGIWYFGMIQRFTDTVGSSRDKSYFAAFQIARNDGIINIPLEEIFSKEPFTVVDPNTEEILGPNQPGELRVKSSFTMLGYYKMDSSGVFDATGWLKTGDIFQYDEDHCFYMIERMKEMIRTVKGDILPATCEHVLMEHPMVNHAAVIGIPQTNGYDFVMGIVTLNKNCAVDPVELQEYVNTRVTDLEKLTAGLKIIQEMPITGNGKILKRILRKMVETGEL